MVAAELAKADAEHTANCERVRQSANKRANLMRELKALGAGGPGGEETPFEAAHAATEE